MKLRDLLDNIENTIIEDEFYVYCPKKVRLKQIKNKINDIFDGIDGSIYDLYYDYYMGPAIYELLNEKNKKKFVSLKHTNKADINKNRIEFLLRGNRDRKTKIKYLLLTIDYKYRNKWLRMMFDRGDKPRRLVVLPLFCFLNHCKIIDMYELLDKNGLNNLKEELRHSEIHYQDINDDYQMYIKDDCVENIKRLIGDYFSIRDFGNVKKYLDVLNCKCNEKDRIKYNKMWIDLEEGFLKAEDDIKNGDHILINWIDALRYDELRNLPFVNGIMKKGIFFENMYGEINDTRNVALGMCTGKSFIEARHFDQNPFDYDNSDFNELVKKNGYHLDIEGLMFKYWIENREIEGIGYLYGGSGYIPGTVWNYRSICDMQENEKSIVFVHSSISEIHYPRWSPMYSVETDDIIENDDYEQKSNLLNQIIGSEKYVDEYMQYYERFFSKVKKRIIMSDHGQLRFEKGFIVEGINHIVFSVLGDNISERVIRNTCSILDFNLILKLLIENRTEYINDEFGRGYAIIQNDDPYSKRLFKLYARDCEGDKLNQWLQYRGIITNNDCYVLFVTGDEYFFLKEDIEKNRIKDENYKDRIEFLKEKNGRLFIDIYKEPKYVAARLLYEKYGLKRGEDNIYL